MLRLRHLIEELGFSSASDLVQSLVGFFSPRLAFLQVGTACATCVLGFIREWVYDPPFALFLIVGLIITETLLVAAVRHKVSKQLEERSFNRAVVILIVYVGLMMVAYWFQKADPLYGFLPKLVFGFFGMRLFISVVRLLNRLGYAPHELLDAISTRVDLKTGQTKEVPPAEPPAPAEGEDPVSDESGISPATRAKALVWLALIGTSLLLCSCATQDRCYRKYGRQTGPTVYVHDTVLMELPAAVAEKLLDSMDVVDLAPGDSLTAVTPDGTATAVLTRLPVQANTLPAEKSPGYRLTARRNPIEHKQPVSLPCPPCEAIEPPPCEPRVVKEMPWWGWGLIWSLLTLLVIQTFRRRPG